MKVLIGNIKNKNSTGIFISGAYKTIRFYKDGQLHREDGPAAIYHTCSYKDWFYKDKYYGENNQFTTKSWKRKVKKIKHLENLNIFK